MSSIIPANEAIAQSGELIQTNQNAIAPVNPGRSLEDVPTYMQVADTSTGMELMQGYVTPPMLRFVQSNSSDEAKLLGEGALYIAPGNIKVNDAPAIGSQSGPPIKFIPMFFYPEFIIWNPQGSKQKIRERTTDPKSEIAKIAKQFDKGKREFPTPEDPNQNMVYQEHLNFVVSLIDGDQAGNPLIYSFARSAHKMGRTLCQQITMRPNIHMTGRVFELCADRQNNEKQQKWWGPLVRPAVGVNGLTELSSEEWFIYCKSQYNYFSELYQERLISASYEEEEEDNPVAANAVKF